MPGANYSVLRERAQQQYGHVTIRDARDLGIDPHALQVMSQRGIVERMSRGVYRFGDVSARPLDGYMAAVLWPYPIVGVLSHVTALDLYDLCDVNPSRIDVTVPPTFRTARTPPAVIDLHRADLSDNELTWYEGIRIVRVRRAILGSIETHLGWHLIEQAIQTAAARGNISESDVVELRALRPQPAPA